jgi:catechol 2,3-dioxygenase-like lactoylglutathione lyase family enzyme
MRIELTSVHVTDQAAALDVYTRVLGFRVAEDFPVGPDRWLTVVSPERPEGPKLLLEPSGHPAAQAYMTALRADGIPAVSFAVDDIAAEHERITGLGLTFTQPPTDVGPVIVALLDDTVGNLVQLVQDKGADAAPPVL